MPSLEGTTMHIPAPTRRFRHREAMCPQPRKHEWVVTPAGKLRVPRACGQWACPVCGPRKAWSWERDLSAACESLMSANPAWGLVQVTLTVRRDWVSPKAAWARARAWRKHFITWVSRWLKKKGQPHEYVWVIRDSADKYPHIHVVFMGPHYLPYELLAACWANLGGGFVWVNRTTLARSLSYLAKQLPGIRSRYATRDRFACSKAINQLRSGKQASS